MELEPKSTLATDNSSRLTTNLDDTCRNQQDIDKFIKVIRKKNQLDKKKNTIEKPTYTNDSDMDKIAETIGILNVN